MDECEVCLTPTIELATVTFTKAPVGAIDVSFCNACFEAILNTMTERYKEAIAGHNAAVNEMMKMLGIEPPEEWGGAGPPPS